MIFSTATNRWLYQKVEAENVRLRAGLQEILDADWHAETTHIAAAALGDANEIRNKHLRRNTCHT